MSDDEVREAAVGAVEVVRGVATPDEIAAAVAELGQIEHADRSDGAGGSDG